MPAVGYQYLFPYYVNITDAYQFEEAPPPPGAGATFSHTVPGDYFEILLFVRCLFTTSATAASRVVRLDMVDTTGAKLASIASPTAQTANGAAGYRWSLGITSQFTSANGDVNMPLFPFVIPPTRTLRLDANSLQAGDTFTLIGLVTQRFPTNMRPESPLDYLRGAPLRAAALEPSGGGGGGTVTYQSPGQTAPAASPAPSGSTAGGGPMPVAPSSPTLTPIPGSGPVIRE